MMDTAALRMGSPETPMPLSQVVESKVRSATTVTGPKSVLDTITNGSGTCEISSGTDAENRPQFITLQIEFESALAGLLKTEEVKAVGVIHTALPATPLRTDGELTEGLVDSDIAKDPARLKTVTTRPNIVRDFLTHGGELHTVYSQSDLDAAKLAQEHNKDGPKVTPESMAIFDQLKKTYPNLHDRPSSQPIGNEHSGATYIATTPKGEQYAFSIRAFQANKPADNATWGIWAGNPLEKPAVAARLDDVKSFLKSHGLQDPFSTASP